MPFNWLSFLQERGIPYVESGPNTKKGNISIRCPFCGEADKSQHMGIDPISGYWGCWRDSEHRGRSPVRLILRLSNLSMSQAVELVYGEGVDPPDGFGSLQTGKLWDRPSDGEPPPEPDLREWDMFYQIVEGYPTESAYRYLSIERGFGRRDAAHLAADYSLRWDRVGRFQGRIILPVFLDGKLVTWTSRAVFEARLRYRDLEVSKSVIPVKNCLYNGDAALRSGGKVLVVVEGPFDALKLDFYGRRFGVRAVAVFTRTLTSAQHYALAELYENFDKCFVMLDNDSSFSEVDSYRLCNSLRSFMPEVKTCCVPGPYKDAGEMIPADVRLFCSQLTR